MSLNENGLWIRLRPIMCVVLGGLGAATLLSHILSGDLITAMTTMVAVGGVAVFLGLKKNFWLAIVLAMMVSVPIVPFGPRWMILSELIVPLALLFLLITHLVAGRGRFRLLAMQNVTVLLYSAWAAMIFFMNPTGFFLFGGEAGGARFYLRIALGFIAFIVISNQELGDREATSVIGLILAGSVLQAVCEVTPWFLPHNYLQEDVFYTWHQSIARPILWVCLWLFARFGVDAVLRAPSWQGGLFAGVAGLSLFSGKRAGVAGILAVPLVTAFITRRGRVRCIAWVAVLVPLVGCLVAGHQRVFQLPLLVQRSIAFLPGQWDVRVTENVQNNFREGLRERAWEIAKEKPLFGLKGYALTPDDFSLQTTMKGSLTDSDLAASSRSWHTTWLGIAADFGIPAAVIWGLFCLQFLWVAGKTHQMAGIGPTQRALVLMILAYFIIELLRSVTGGHSAWLAYDLWWLYGLVVAVHRTVASSTTAALQAPEPDKIEQPQTLFPVSKGT